MSDTALRWFARRSPYGERLGPYASQVEAYEMVMGPNTGTPLPGSCVWPERAGEWTFEARAARRDCEQCKSEQPGNLALKGMHTCGRDG